MLVDGPPQQIRLATGNFTKPIPPIRSAQGTFSEPVHGTGRQT